MDINNSNRRKFLKNSLLSIGGIYLGANFISCNDDDVTNNDSNNGDNNGGDNNGVSQDTSFDNLTLGNFDHGVASFDPTHNQVIIWTRYNTAQTAATIKWQIAHDVNFETVIRSGEVTTDATRDYTIAIELQNLESNKKIYYRFGNLTDGKVSIIGETITLPQDPTMLKFAVCSCSNYPAGFFNVYQEMANSDVDIILHLGDYIYEYGHNEYGSNNFTSTNNRNVEPSTELLTLDDYRTRYKQYRTDTDLILAHQKKPFICVWDDHEIANDAWTDGAQNHQDNEGSWNARKIAAIQAYSEYLPLRTSDYNLIYRNFEFGNLVNLIMLDTRIIGRNQQLNYVDYRNENGFDNHAFEQDWQNPQRTILGTTQRQWLTGQASVSNATWQVLGQQVLFAKTMVPAELLPIVGEILSGTSSPETLTQLNQLLIELSNLKLRSIQNDDTLTPEELERINNVLPYNLDAWDGYPAERQAVLDAFHGKKLISLAGDTHNGWANILSGATGMEFATSSVSSPGFEKYLGTNPQALAGFEQAFRLLSDDVKYLNSNLRGYLYLTFTSVSVDAQWRFIDTVFSRAYSVSILHTENFTG